MLPLRYLNIGFSPCPNDTFIFDALIHGKIDTSNLRFNAILEDVESLNRIAFNEELDITKLSFFAYAHLSDKYQILDSGAALGKGVGPLLISAKKINQPEQEIKSVAIPGKYTTANFLFSLFYPEVKNKKEMLFSEIEEAVATGEVDAGVIIHENRFTYEKKGLHRICDLGSRWEEETGQAIPLGGIAVKRSLDEGLKQEINSLIRKSVQFAKSNPASSIAYVKKHAQEMQDDVIQKHINLYVNDFSIDLGEKGHEALRIMFDKTVALHLVDSMTEPLFLNSEHLQS